MKIKVRPEDFVVEEIAEMPVGRKGAYGVYLLTKRGWNTVDLLKRLSREIGVSFRDISYGGKKDRHAVTKQYVTIKGCGPLREGRLSSTAANYSLLFLGYSERPMGPDLIAGNRFEITVRSLEGRELSRAAEALPQAARDGYPNYFDDQRFGSYDPRQGFIAEKILREHYNGALKIYMTHVHPEDKGAEKERKRYFSAHWGNWRRCYEKSETGLEQTVFGYLSIEPKGFLPLLQRVPREEMSLFFSAYQSFLWNEVLRRVLAETGGEGMTRYRGIAGDYLFCGLLEKARQRYLAGLQIPTPAAGADMTDEAVARLYAALLEERGIRLSMFNVRSVRQAFFKSVLRSAVVVPAGLSAEEDEDDLYQGRMKLALRFVLPRGSYGSMLVKRLFSV